MRLRRNHKLYDVYLGDDGTMDTVIEVSDYHGHQKDVRFDGEFTSTYRLADGSMTKRGLKELGLEAIESLEEEICMEEWSDSFESNRVQS